MSSLDTFLKITTSCSLTIQTHEGFSKVHSTDEETEMTSLEPQVTKLVRDGSGLECVAGLMDLVQDSLPGPRHVQAAATRTRCEMREGRMLGVRRKSAPQTPETCFGHSAHRSQCLLSLQTGTPVPLHSHSLPLGLEQHLGPWCSTGL